MGIPMAIGPAPFWTNPFLCNYEPKYIINLIRTNKLRGRRFHSTFRFIDDFFALNYGGEFGKGFLEIYPAKLELKMEHNGSHETFLDLDVSIDKCKFIHKMFDKRHAFNFQIVRTPSITSNIPPIIFFSFRM